MYYIAVSSIGRINVGEKLLLVEDRDFDEISAIRPGGEVVGYVVSFGIDGCLTKEFLSRVTSSGNGIICDVAIKSGDVIILSSDGSYHALQHDFEVRVGSFY